MIPVLPVAAVPCSSISDHHWLLPHDVAIDQLHGLHSCFYTCMRSRDGGRGEKGEGREREEVAVRNFIHLLGYVTIYAGDVVVCVCVCVYTWNNRRYSPHAIALIGILAWSFHSNLSPPFSVFSTSPSPPCPCAPLSLSPPLSPSPTDHNTTWTLHLTYNTPLLGEKVHRPSLLRLKHHKINGCIQFVYQFPLTNDLSLHKLTSHIHTENHRKLTVKFNESVPFHPPRHHSDAWPRPTIPQFQIDPTPLLLLYTTPKDST